MTAPSLFILGTDVVLAAAPATPLQLAHACLAAGYHTVIPATWGDELIAARTLDRVREAGVPLVQCSCPLVAGRLAANGPLIAPMLLSLVSPPVATALYLRAICAPTRPTITYAGGCAAGRDAAIDIWMSAEALLSHLSSRGIDLRAQPTEFDSVLPPDRRRFFSEPGGVPTRAALRRLPSPVELLELGEEDLIVELGQRLLSPLPALIDAAPALGCHCMGSASSTRADVVRARIRELEPPRSNAPIVDHSVPLSLEIPFAAAVAFTATVSEPKSRSPLVHEAPSSLLPHPQTPMTALEESHSESGSVAIEEPTRRTPQALSRAVLGAMPHARTETGRQLPRAYVARRRSSPHGVRQSSIRRAQPDPEIETRSIQTRWFVIAGTGVVAGLILAWLLLAV